MISYSSGLFNKKYGETLLFVHDNFRYFVKEIKNWDGCSVYAKKFNKLEEYFFAKGKTIFTPKSNGFNVLNHGNLTLNNLLINNVDGINVNFVI